MVDSYSVDQKKVKPSQAAGTYFLAKQLVDVTVKKIVTGDKTSYSITTATVSVPDNRYTMQVGFALSPLSNDDIKVIYDKGLLKQVSAIADDRTTDVVLAIAKDLTLLRNATAAPAPTETIMRFQFDPYNAAQAAAVNRQIAKSVGGTESSCVEVEIHPGVWSPGCGNHSMALGASVALDTDPPNYEAAPFTRKPGIYYRRGMPRTVHTMLRGKEVETRQMLFANDGPIYRVDVKRTMFVKRETVIDFTDGELVSVSVKKPSEAVAVATLPVAVVDAYVGGVVDAFTRRQKVQEARATYYTSLATRIRNDVEVSKARDERDKYECLAAHPVDTTECD